MNSMTINLEKFVTKSIVSRDIVKNILEYEISKLDKQIIYLNFNKIEFVSRSAAHELLKMKERFEYDKQQKKEVIFKNLTKNVAEMLRIVAADNAYSIQKKVKFNPKKINISDLVQI